MVCQASPARRTFTSFLKSCRQTAWKKQTFSSFIYAPNALLFCLGLKYGAEEPVLPRLENPTLDAILRYIDEHPDKAITANDLAQRFFVSTSWIVHGFREHLGITLMQYVNRKRILYAEQQIRAGASPTTVAKACHYDSYVTFYRQFKKYLGYPPTGR